MPPIIFAENAVKAPRSTICKQPHTHAHARAQCFNCISPHGRNPVGAAKINNDKARSQHQRIAVNAFIDGSPANLTPMLVGASRTIEGFTQERNTTEFVQDRKSSYSIVNIVRTFVAKKPATTGSVTDHKIGKVHFEFFAVKTKTMWPGRHTRDHVSERSDTRSQGCAQPGVMQTNGGQEVTRCGNHFSGGNRKPMADYRSLLGSFTLTICDQSLTVLDFIPARGRRAAAEEPEPELAAAETKLVGGGADAPDRF
jgi:hypothetical protein